MAPLIQFTKDEPKPHGGQWKKGQRMTVTNERRDELVKAGKAKQVQRIPASYSEPDPEFRSARRTKQDKAPVAKEASKKSASSGSSTKKKESTKTKN